MIREINVNLRRFALFVQEIKNNGYEDKGNRHKGLQVL